MTNFLSSKITITWYYYPSGESKQISYFILSVILANAEWIGLELTNDAPLIYYLQKACLTIFIIEVFLR